MRIGKQMLSILKVLDSVEEPSTITNIIMKVKGFNPLRPRRYIQQELDSAIAGKSLTSWMGGYEKVRGKVNILYASFSKSIRLLHKHKLISTPDRWVKLLRSESDRMEDLAYRNKANRCKFIITKKGKEILASKP